MVVVYMESNRGVKEGHWEYLPVQDRTHTIQNLNWLVSEHGVFELFRQL